MLGTVGRHVRRQFVGYLALFIALGGVSYAAVTLPRNSVGSSQIKNRQVKNADLGGNAVTSGKVKNGSLLSIDFKPGQLVAGAPGATGATGAQGPKGDTGLTGPKGDTGAAGAAATKLLAAVDAACVFKRGIGAVSSALNGEARCDVTFDRDVSACFAQVTVRADPSSNSAELTASTAGEPGGYVGLENNEVAVVYHDSAGALTTTERPPFYIAVFC
jgi:hypothetical protein